MRLFLFFICFTMKKIWILLYFFFFFYCFLFYQNVTQLTADITQTFLQHVFPSLFPMLLLSELFLSSGLLSKIVEKNSKIGEIFLIFLTGILGCPSALPFLNRCQKMHLISKERKDLLLCCFGGVSFSYLSSLLLYHQTTEKDGILFFLLYLGEFFLYFCFRKKEIRNESYLCPTLNRSSLNKAILSSGKTFFLIFSTTLLWNYFFAFFPGIYERISPLTMWIEFSYSGFYVHQLPFFQRYFFLTLLLSFTSISVFFQLVILDKDYPISSHIKMRFLITFCNLLLSLLFLF